MEQYIPKSALVAEIEKLIDEIYAVRPYDSLSSEQQTALWYVKSIMSSINTLEVKEVDLDFQRFAKEMETVFALPSSETKNTEEEPLNWEYAIAKHFFELGFKAQKGE